MVNTSALRAEGPGSIPGKGAVTSASLPPRCNFASGALLCDVSSFGRDVKPLVPCAGLRSWTAHVKEPYPYVEVGGIRQKIRAHNE